VLGSGLLVGFVATTDLARATAFYRDVLGLEVVEETPIATTHSANGAVVRVTVVDQHSPPPYTVLGWTVRDIDELVTALGSRSVQFERFAGMDQDAHGVWTAPGGDRVAWFRDPDGNLLSVTEPRRN